MGPSAALACLLLAVTGVSAVTLQSGQVPESGIKRFSKLSAGEWDPDSLSGPGSKPDVAKPFVEFFLGWLKQHPNVTSMVESSAGHWPSGWQRFVEWPGLDYVGVDILPEVVEADEKYLADTGIKKLGLKSMRFMKGDMLKAETLPKADLFFTKDTLIHFPNKFISQFLDSTAKACPPKYKYVMFVHDFRPRNDWNNADIRKFGEYHGFDLKNAPFNMPVETVFKWTTAPGQEG